MAGKWTKWTKIYQYLSLQHPPKFTQIVIFGLKIYHLATLVSGLFPLVGQNSSEDRIRQSDQQFKLGAHEKKLCIRVTRLACFSPFGRLFSLVI
jgi:hypothetical protein